MPILDCFCGLGPWRSRDRLLPYEPAEILKLMDHFGIGKALVYSNMAMDYGWAPDCNRVLEEAAAGSDRFIPAFVIAPGAYEDSPKLDDYINAMRRAGARTLWVRLPKGTNVQGLWSWLIGDTLEFCSAARVPALFHAEGVSADEIHRLCADFPRLRLILTGLGYNVDAWLFPLLRRHPNVCVSLGHYYVPADGPMRFVKHIGAERLIFGSGLPQFSPGGLIAHVTYAAIPDADKELILSGNLHRLLSEATL